VVLQPVTGFLLAWWVGYSLTEGWIVLSLLLYLITGAFWVPVVFMQIKMRDLAMRAAAEGTPLPEVTTEFFAAGLPSASRPSPPCSRSSG